MALVLRPPRAGHRRRTRAVAILLLVGGLLFSAAACGMNVQTMRPYTPADGVNVDVGNPSVQVRNLMILSRRPPVGFVSASLTASDRDSLTSVAGRPIKTDGTPGTPFTVTQPNPIAFGNGQLLVLTDRQLIQVQSPDLVVGGTAELTLMFSTAGSVTLRVPVVDANQPAYASISPTPSASPSA